MFFKKSEFFLITVYCWRTSAPDDDPQLLPSPWGRTQAHPDQQFFQHLSSNLDRAGCDKNFQIRFPEEALVCQVVSFNCGICFANWESGHLDCCSCWIAFIWICQTSCKVKMVSKKMYWLIRTNCLCIVDTVNSWD